MTPERRTWRRSKVLRLQILHGSRRGRPSGSIPALGRARGGPKQQGSVEVLLGELVVEAVEQEEGDAIAWLEAAGQRRKR
jgi:hypothetical protein